VVFAFHLFYTNINTKVSHARSKHFRYNHDQNTPSVPVRGGSVSSFSNNSPAGTQWTHGARLWNVIPCQLTDNHSKWITWNFCEFWYFTVLALEQPRLSGSKTINIICMSHLRFFHAWNIQISVLVLEYEYLSKIYLFKFTCFMHFLVSRHTCIASLICMRYLHDTHFPTAILTKYFLSYWQWEILSGT
jgi:hypothetical protein